MVWADDGFPVPVLMVPFCHFQGPVAQSERALHVQASRAGFEVLGQQAAVP
jgi:hypothetical protein